MIPKLKKKICAFLTKEDGKISKKTLLTLGVAAASISAIQLAAAHVSTYSGCSPSKGTLPMPADHVNSIHANALTATPSEHTVSSSHSQCVETHASHTSY